MKIIKINFAKPDRKSLDQIASYFLQGKIIVFPTDTIYGLGCLATNKNSVKKIFKIKQRSPKKALLVLVKSIAQLKKFALVSTEQQNYLKKYWPGPNSFVLSKKDVLPAAISAGKETIAFRLPKNDFLIKILKRVDAPLIATSLNIAGKKSLLNTASLSKHFSEKDLDVVVDIGSDLIAKPSSLRDISNIADIKVLRK